MIYPDDLGAADQQCLLPGKEIQANKQLLGMDLSHLKVAVVHEWLTTYAGSEKVTQQILNLFPQADLFAVIDFLPERDRQFLTGRRITTSFIQRLPKARRYYRSYVPLMPLAVEQFELSGYDLVISSNHAVAKGVITGPNQIHISYIHTPMRYAWDLQHQYLRESGLQLGLKSWITRCFLHYLRMWDVRTANGVDYFLANSAFIARRVRKVYGKPAKVIYPPVDVERFKLRQEKEGFYLAASRMVPYKHMVLIAKAFAAMPDKQLVMIGEGVELEKVRAIADRVQNIKVLGFQVDEVLADYMGRARALVFAAEEDFGIMPVEAQACGTPVIAFAGGGVLETVIADVDPRLRTGLFFDRQSVDSLQQAIHQFESMGQFDPEVCRSNALRFSQKIFTDSLLQVVEAALAEFGAA